MIACSGGSAAFPSWAGLGLYGIAFVLFCATACFALLGIVLRFERNNSPVWDSLGANAYGIYLLHYPVVTWTQYALLGIALEAVVKATVDFVTAMLLSWGATIALRSVPGVAHVV